MSDLISRQAAIDAINHICPVDTEYDCTLLDRVDVRYVLSDLPSAQPEREKGKWVFSRDDAEGICTMCNFKIYGRPYNNTYLFVPYNYCPNCGAKMDGGR